MAGLNRRDFLKALGLTGGASMVSACGFDDNLYRTPIEHVLPYVVRPDQIIPGNPVFFATTIGSGPRAYPVVARNREGRVLHVGSNKTTPLAPAVPRQDLFELQRHYSPDRIKAPQAAGQAVTWDAGLQQLADAVKAAKAAGRKVAYLGGYKSGAIVELLRAYTDDNAYFWEPLGYEAEALAAEKLFGQRILPAYDLSKAHFVLSFGADFLGNWGNPVLAPQYSDARNPNKGRFVARFALVSPHRNQTGANADDWYMAAPGSEAQVALAIASLVAGRVGYNGPLSALLSKADVDGAATASGIDRATLEAIAAQFAAAPAVALPGGVTGASKAATDLAVATYVLNLVSNNGGVTFGVGPHYAGPIDGAARLDQLLADMKAKNVAVLLLDDVNPMYALPGAAGVAEALAGVDLVVALSSHPDETNANAKLVLPLSDAFEDWGDEEPFVGFHIVRQPSMTALNDTRSLGDVLLATARAAGLGGAAAAAPAAPAAGAAAAAPTKGAKGAPAAGAASIAASAPTTPAALGFTAENWREYVKSRWQRDVHQGGDFVKFWEQALADGFVDNRPKLDAPNVTATDYAFAGSGAADGQGDLFLIAYPHSYLHDGRYANEPWAQEVADPMTGFVWDSWVEIHPDTAAKMGIAYNDLVEVTTADGKVQVGAYPLASVHPNAIAITFGNGHEAAGRYADGTGVNVVKLLGYAKDAQGAMAWQSAKASVKATGGKADLVTTFGNETEEHRGFGPVADAAKLAEVGDDPAERPGELTGLEETELDERLQKAGITDFYPIPDHPTYRFGMTIDVNACNGCSACQVACYAENNLPVVGKIKVAQGREMAWIRVNRYWSEEDGNPQEIRFVPMLCQQCAHAPCESVCPVLATYHSIDGLNAMVYNRCVGTRYCANNCPYVVRRFNWHSYVWPEPFNLQLNPDVSVRTMGVMEKCTFCVQRIRATKSAYRNQGFTTTVPDEALRRLPACADACPTGAITFGNLNDETSTPNQSRKSGRSYLALAELNTFPAINYLAKASFHPPARGEVAEGGGTNEPPTDERAPRGEPSATNPSEQH